MVKYTKSLWHTTLIGSLIYAVYSLGFGLLLINYEMFDNGLLYLYALVKGIIMGVGVTYIIFKQQEERLNYPPKTRS